MCDETEHTRNLCEIGSLINVSETIRTMYENIEIFTTIFPECVHEIIHNKFKKERQEEYCLL